MNLGGTIHLNKTGICVLGVLIVILLLYSSSNKNSTEEKAQSSKINLNKLLDVAIKAAENGGIKVVETKDNQNVESKGLTKEGLEDSVTTADFLSHCWMTDTLKHFFPSVKVISEEAKTVCENDQQVDYILNESVTGNLPIEDINEEDITIWIDPLDATHEYTEKLYSFVTTMVCVAVKGKPLIGVIHRPFAKSTSWAWVGKVKSKDLDIKIPQRSANDNLRLIISMSHQGEIQRILKKSFGEHIQLVSAAGAGYKVLEVATGRADAYLHTTAIKKWDICAGNAILNALGGKMTTKHDKEIDYSDEVGVKNEDGLVATLTNHEMFLGKL